MPPEPASLAARLKAAPPLADPKRARARLADLSARAEAKPEAEVLRPLLDGGSFRDLVLALAEHSTFLWQLAAADPIRLARLAATPPEETLRALCAAQGDRFRAFPHTPRDDIARAFRRARAEHALLVALADLGGVWGVEEVTAALASFADASVAGAVRVALKEAEAQGRLTLRDPDDPGRGSGLVVLALGKHGAGELNYSSDIDLVVFFDPETAPLAAGAEPATAYTRIAQSVARLLGERTADGYVHRVDYRLRPDPASTPTAVSLPPPTRTTRRSARTGSGRR
jgi:glutamate-ammonia-ligase adenylyltransferase